MLSVLLAILVVLASLAGYSALRFHQIRRSIRPDGEMCTVDGVQLHYHFFSAENACPDTPTLVFLHGASGNAYDSQLAFLKPLKGRYPLLFLDRPGLGFSGTIPDGKNSPARQAELIDGLLRELGIDRCIAIGHSLGASVTAALGLRAPDQICGLAFLAPATHPWPGGVAWYNHVAAAPVIGWLFCRILTLPVAEYLAPRSIQHVFHPEPQPENYNQATRLPLLFLPDAFRSNATDIARLKPHVIAQSKDYGDLEQPTVILTGTEDTVVWPSIHSEGLLRDLPNAELVVLEGAGHMPHHTRTDAIVEALDQLVLRVGRAGVLDCRSSA